MAGVPRPIVEMARIQGDASPVQNYILAEAKRKASLSGPEGFGKAGAVYQDPVTGEFKAIQFGERGTLKTHDLQGMRPAKGVKQVGDELVDNATGETVRGVAPQLVGKERAEEVGKAQGKAQVDLPRIVANADQAFKVIDQIRSHPGKQYGIGAIGGWMPAIPGTSQAGFVDLVNQAKGKAFLEAFNSLKGAGQITEVEGQKATEAIARLNRARRAEDFETALKDFEDVVRSGVERAQRAAGPPAANPSPGGYSIRRLD